MLEDAQDRGTLDSHAQLALFDPDRQNIGAKIGLQLVAKGAKPLIHIDRHADASPKVP
jgi:hypothetical protein